MATEVGVGTVLGGTYRLTRQIGAGGMGSVFAAEHARVPRQFAIKLLNPEVVGNRDVFDRFRREAEIASSIGHESIVQVFDFNYTDDGVPYMVLELLDGQDLADKLRTGGPMTLEQTLALLDALAGALDAAHQRGIVHRDLKPQNIFMCKVGSRVDVPKILDFGISKVMHSESGGTKTGSIFGTPNYMSPEQAQGKVSDIDARTDIFALGCILYECLTGVRAFDAPTAMGAIYKVVHTVPDPLRAYNPSLPDSVEAVLQCAMAKERNQRYPTTAALRDEFVAAVQGSQPPMAAKLSMRMSAVMGRALTPVPFTAAEPSLSAIVGSQTPLTGVKAIPAAPASRASVAVPAAPAPVTTLGASAGQVASVAPVPGPTQAAKSRTPMIAVASVAVVALLGGGAFFALRGHGGGEARSASTAKPTPEPPPAPAPGPGGSTNPAGTVSIEVSVGPPGATVELDGVGITANPLVLPISSQTHKLVFSAPGYVSQTRDVTAQVNGKITVNLEKTQVVPTPAAGTSPPVVATKPPAPAGKPGAPAKPDGTKPGKKRGGLIEDDF